MVDNYVLSKYLLNKYIYVVLNSCAFLSLRPEGLEIMVGWFQGRGEKVLCSTNGIECITRINSQSVLSNKIDFPCSMCVTLRQVYASPIGVFYQTWTRLFQISSWRISTSFDEAQVKPDATRREPTHFYVRRLTRRDFYLVSLTVRHSIRNILTQDECNI